MTKIETSFWSANEAFEYFYKTISKHGGDFADTKTLFNIGFTLLEPRARRITSKMRNWKEDYAEAEWLSGWIALTFLSDPNMALQHFKNFYNNVGYPISLSRGAYWM